MDAVYVVLLFSIMARLSVRHKSATTTKWRRILTTLAYVAIMALFSFAAITENRIILVVLAFLFYYTSIFIIQKK